MIDLKNELYRFLHERTAATMVEYALMLALVALVCVAAVGVVGTSTETLFADSAARIAEVVP